MNGDEAAHFKREGFIVKRGLIDDTEIFQKVVDFIWTKVPRGLLRREDSDTWINPADDEQPPVPAQSRRNVERSGGPKRRSRRK